jgi:hypothetical protein
VNQGVEIILKRMDSNPEEFQMFDDYPSAGKWHWLMYPLNHRGHALTEQTPNSIVSNPPPLAHLSDEEVVALYKKLMEVQGEAFTQRVLKTMLDEPEQKDWVNVPVSQGYATQSLSATDRLQQSLMAQKIHDAAKGKATQNKINSKKWTG